MRQIFRETAARLSPALYTTTDLSLLAGIACRAYTAATTHTHDPNTPTPKNPRNPYPPAPATQALHDAWSLGWARGYPTSPEPSSEA